MLGLVLADAKEQVRIRRRSPARQSAEIEIAIGPENASARRTKGLLFGRRERTIFSTDA
jgi:hypothetical protein